MIYNFDNNGTIILTSQNPEAFLTFISRPGDPSNYFVPYNGVGNGFPTETYYVNGIDACLLYSYSDDYKLMLGGPFRDPSITSFHIYTRKTEDFDQVFSIYSASECIKSWTNYGLSSFVPRGKDFLVGAGYYPNYTRSNTFDVSINLVIDISITTPTNVLPSFYIQEIGLADPSYYNLSAGMNHWTHTLSAGTSSAYVVFEASTNATPTVWQSINSVLCYRIKTHDISILNRPFLINGEINVYETSNIQNDDNASYLVLRTNPKFTGNVKLVVDSSDLIYLDTFKISDILNNKLYRKQKLSANSILSGDIRRTFSTLPRGEMYRVDKENTLNIAIPKTDYYKQYNHTYTYGARLFEDELYEEDYSMLAPLWINNNLPDYFTIFRVSGPYNTETYNSLSLKELAKTYVEGGEIVKSWSFKEDVPLGIYMRNYLDDLLEIKSSVFLSLSDPVTTKDPDPNTWYGIAVDKGVLTGRSETTYFFDQQSTLTDLNAFVSNGFERLNLLCPNLINMEYAFSDDDPSMYKMNRYFGLYLTENELYNVTYYCENIDTSVVELISLDGKDSSLFFDSSIFNGYDGDINVTYKNRIFSINDGREIRRISNVKDVNGINREFIEDWINKPNDNIFSAAVVEREDLRPFISFKLNNLLNQGEHLRVINETSNEIWEVYSTNIDLLEAGQSFTYASSYSSIGYPTIYRTCFSSKGTMNDQIDAIERAFDVFEGYLNFPIETKAKKEYALSLEIKEWALGNVFKFQRLTAQTVDNVDDPSSIFNTAANCNDIIFYGVLSPSDADFERVRYDSSFGPINFELFGDRMSITIDMFDPSGYYSYSLDSSMTAYFEDNILYHSTDNQYRLIESFDVSTALNRSYLYVLDPGDETEEDDKILVITKRPISTVGVMWNAYSIYPLSISLMGINPVKDIDFTVYDSSRLNFQSEYKYAREDDVSTYLLQIPDNSICNISARGSYNVISGFGTLTINSDTTTIFPTRPFNTFNGEASIATTSKMIVTYDVLNGTKTFSSYKNNYSEEYLDDFYDTSTTLRYGLTVPTVAKWVGLGSDCRNMPFRLLLDSSGLENRINYIPTKDGSFSDEISYPVFKYLSPATRAWESYVYYDINDVVVYTDDGSTYYKTIKELILENPSVDIFSKFVYSSIDNAYIKDRTSMLYYNDFKDGVDTIITGLNLTFKADDSAKSVVNIADWDRYRFSFVSSPSRNRDNNYPMEVFINENTKTILMVWYQGGDDLNYNRRHSTFFGGKSILDSAGGVLNFRSFSDSSSSFAKTPFVVNNSRLVPSIKNIYNSLNNYEVSTCTPYAQLNWNFTDDLHSIFNAYNYNYVTSQVLYFNNKSYDTFDGSVSYNYLHNAATYGNNIMNYGYTYSTNTNLYREKICGYDQFSYIVSKGFIKYYIIKEDGTYTNEDFTNTPISITINEPKQYKNITTYGGWYRPKFNNIFNFNSNEPIELINTVEKDFVFANTNLKSYNYIPQYWYNKVVDKVTSADVSVGNAIKYAKNYNVFNSQWDLNYYILDTSAGEKYINGYYSDLEVPSFFGSKLIQLPEYLVLDTWDANSATSTDDRKNYTLKFNLTRAIVSMFRSNSDFVSNWSGLSGYSSMLDKYIKTTILSYYNINMSKIKVECWSKPYTGRNISYTLDSTFDVDYGKNFNVELIFRNNEYIHTFKVSRKISRRTYYFKFTLFEK